MVIQTEIQFHIPQTLMIYYDCTSKNLPQFEMKLFPSGFLPRCCGGCFHSTTMSSSSVEDALWNSRWVNQRLRRNVFRFFRSETVDSFANI